MQKKMKVHEIKIAPKWYAMVLVGQKPWELRVNDRNYKQGDFLFMREWENGQYTEREILVKVVAVAEHLPYLPEDVVIMTTATATMREYTQFRKLKEAGEISW